MSSRISYALAVIVLLLAAGLRLWQLTALPIGLSEPELANVDLMRDSIKRGDIRVLYDNNGEGQEGFYHSALALATIVFGTGTMGLRIMSVFAALVMLALLYAVGVRLFGHLAALAAIALLAVLMWPALLSRLVLVETVLPLLVTALLLALARALPVYSHSRSESSTTIDFAALGILLGLGLYVHPDALMLVLMAMAFITYIVLTVRPLSMRRLSTTGFAILMVIIIAMPYLITTIRLPELNASTRIFGDYQSITRSFVDSISGLLIRGDSDALHNLPGRPLLDIVSGTLMFLGVALSIRRWQQPKYALLLFAAVFLAPPALLADNSPNFLGLGLVLPVIALSFGLGLSWLLKQVPERFHTAGLVAALALLVFNLGWTGRDLFGRWPGLDGVHTAYNGDIGQLAQYVDRSAGTTPTVFCYPGWHTERDPNTVLSAAEHVLLLMNRDASVLRFVDCGSGFVFPDAGRNFQVVFSDPDIAQNLPPDIAAWLALGTAQEDVPDGSVIVLDIERELADALGLFTTSSPASFVTDTDVSDRIPVPPPIRFGGNVTWLGYQTASTPTYAPGDNVPVITYWRVEGPVPSDLVIFNHILSDPVTPVANRDILSANPAQLQERDVFVQIAEIPLPDNMLPATYDISVGLYQDSSDERLPVFSDAGAVRGDRIFLYTIDVMAPDTSETDG